MTRPAITAERLRELLSYDPETGVFRWKDWRNGRVDVGQAAGWISLDGYIKLGIDGKTYHAARLAWFHENNEWPPDTVDHINTVRTDNRIKNLRLATRGQNMQNQRKAHSHSKTGILGVTVADSGRWVAQMRVNSRTRHIGTFDTPQEASAAYVEAKARLHPFQTIVPKEPATE